MATKSTKFAPGRSGNPKGRPKGIQDKRVALRELLEPHAPALVDRVVKKALKGDTAALRICLERLMPPLKATDSCATVTLAGATTEQAQAVVAAVAGGAITPDQGSSIMDLLLRQVRIFDSEELERRIASLEADRVGAER